MSIFVVNMSGREFTEQERNDLMDQFFSEDVDYKIHDVDHYGRYRFEEGLSPLSRIVGKWLTAALELGDMTYEDQLVLIVPMDTSLYEMHQTYKTLMHSWLVHPPRLIFSYVMLTGSDYVPAQFTHQEVVFKPVIEAVAKTKLARAEERMSLKEVQEHYLPGKEIIRDVRIVDAVINVTKDPK